MKDKPQPKKHAAPDNAPAPDAIERMNKALEKMLETPPETHDEMIKRRRTGRTKPDKSGSK